MENFIFCSAKIEVTVSNSNWIVSPTLNNIKVSSSLVLEFWKIFYTKYFNQ